MKPLLLILFSSTVLAGDLDMIEKMLPGPTLLNLREMHNSTLAPNPLNFKREEVMIDGQKYILTNENGTVEIKQAQPEIIPSVIVPPTTTPSPTHGDYYVEAVFSFWHDPIPEINEPATASYVVRKSNHPMFPLGAHVEKERFVKYGFSIPFTPEYDEWIKGGRIKTEER